MQQIDKHFQNIQRNLPKILIIEVSDNRSLFFFFDSTLKRVKIDDAINRELRLK